MKRLILVVALVALAATLNMATPVQADDPCRDKDGNEICVRFFSFDERVNQFDELATVTAYCQGDHSLDVWSIDNSQGTFLFKATVDRLSSALSTARAKNTTILIQSMRDRSLYALATTELQISGPGYNFRFPGTACGGINLSAPTNFQPAKPAGSTGKSIGSATAATASNAQVYGTATTNSMLNMRAAPDIHAAAVAVIPSKAVVNVIGRDAKREWIKVQYNNQEGWVYAYFTAMGVSMNRLPIVP